MGLSWQKINYLSLSNGEKIAFRKKEGGSQVIVLIHGNMSSSYHWDSLVENLSDDYTVFAFDLRGFGHSSYNNSINTISDLSQDIEECLQLLDLTDITIVGWSLGGPVCMDLCIYDTAKRIKNCVLLCSASTRGYPYYVRSLKRVAQSKDDICKDYGTSIMKYLQDSHNLLGLKFVCDNSIYKQTKPPFNREMHYMEEVSLQRNITDVNYALHKFNVFDKVKEIEANITIVYGENDIVVSQEMTNQMIQDFNGLAKVIELKKCGHSPMTDQLEQVTKIIENVVSI